MQLNKNTIAYSTPTQLKLQLDFEKIIDISDPVYGFCEVMDRIDLSKFFADKERKTGRPRCDLVKMLKLVLFSFMENGYMSLRGLEKACRTDIRYMWILDGMQPPSFMTFDNFINQMLCDSVEEVFKAVNQVIFEQDGVDLSHAYIDGTKIEANANKYSYILRDKQQRSICYGSSNQSPFQEESCLHHIRERERYTLLSKFVLLCEAQKCPYV